MSDIENVLRTLLAESLPGLFGGATPAVRLAIVSDVLTLDPQSADAVAGAPAPDDRRDRFAYQRDPAATYTLTQPPYPGPRRARLATDAGDAVALRDDEVLWDAVDTHTFTLRPRPVRDLASISGVEVLYSVTAVFTKLKALRVLGLDLTCDDATKLEQAELLTLAVATLDRARMIELARANYEDGRYGAEVEVKRMQVQRGERLESGARRLTLAAELELKIRRALADDEGRPITSIRTPGMPDGPQRPIDLRVDLDV